MALIPLVIMLGLMWLLLIRPQRQQVQRHHAFVSSLAVGDEIMTAGGVYGRITALEGSDAMVEIAPGVEVRVLLQRLLAVPFDLADVSDDEIELSDLSGDEIDLDDDGTLGLPGPRDPEDGR